MIISSKNFKIGFIDYFLTEKEDGQILKNSLINFSNFTGNTLDIFGTYNEKLTEKANDQYDFSFSIEMFHEGKRNPFIDYLVIDRKIVLQREGYTNIEFYITGKTPNFSSDNISYTFTCQDAFSYEMTKENIDLSFSTEDEELWGERIGPQPIDNIINKVLYMIGSDWVVDPNMNFGEMQFPDNLYYNHDYTPMKVSLEMENTSPYNIIIETLKIFDAVMTLDFNKKVIYLRNKEKLKYKGLRLKPEINLSSFGYSEKADSLYNIMYVSGGEDAEGSLVSMIEPMPTALCDLFINLDTEYNARIGEEPSLLAKDISFKLDSNNLLEESKLYPNVINVREKDNKDDKEGKGAQSYQMKTSISENKINYSIISDSDAVKDLDWKSAVTVEDLVEKIKNIIDYINNKVTDTSLITKINTEGMESFFESLNKLPHYDSFLYDFKYWEESGLLNLERSKKLHNLLDIDMRNINILLSAYVTMYNKYKYYLDRLVQREEELISQLAALEEQEATFVKENSSISVKQYYASQSIYFKDKDKKSYNLLPVGSNSINKNKIQYGVTKLSVGSEIIRHQVPDLKDLSSVNKLYYIDNESLVEVEFTFNKDLESNLISFTSDVPLNTMFYFKMSDLDTYFENQEEYKDNTILSNDRDKIRTELADLWNTSYFYYYKILYGDSWFYRKKEELENKKLKKEKEKQEALDKMIAEFGENWSIWKEPLNAKILSKNVARYVVFSDYLSIIDNCSTYIGGEGTKKDNNGDYITFKGYYNTYLDLLEELKNKSIDITGEEPAVASTEELKSFVGQPLSDIINTLKVKKKQKKDELYNNFFDIIRETRFEDTEQLTSSALYNSAKKQFLSVNKPAKSYSSSYITMDDLMDFRQEINVGDKIILDHGSLGLKKNNKLKIIVNKKVPYTKTCTLDFGYITKEEEGEYIREKVDVLEAKDNYLIVDLSPVIDKGIEISSLKGVFYGSENFMLFGSQYLSTHESFIMESTQTKTITYDLGKLMIGTPLVLLDSVELKDKEGKEIETIEKSKMTGKVETVSYSGTNIIIKLTYNGDIDPTMKDYTIVFNCDISCTCSSAPSKILSIEEDYDSTPVELRITGISRDLRSDIVQLTVEENTLYNTMISRMVYLMAKKR